MLPLRWGVGSVLGNLQPIVWNTLNWKGRVVLLCLFFLNISVIILGQLATYSLHLRVVLPQVVNLGHLRFLHFPEATFDFAFSFDRTAAMDHTEASAWLSKRFQHLLIMTAKCYQERNPYGNEESQALEHCAFTFLRIILKKLTLFSCFSLHGWIASQIATMPFVLNFLHVCKQSWLWFTHCSWACV